MTSISYDWRQLEADNGVPFSQPFAISPYIRRTYSHAAIYRWIFTKVGERGKVYFGQSGNLARRLQEYLKSGKPSSTNARIRKLIEKANSAGFEVRLELLTILQPCYLNAVLVADGNIGNWYIRNMLENFVIADCDAVNYEVLNYYDSPTGRRRRKAQRDRELAGF